MAYHYSKTVDLSFEDAIKRAEEVLQSKGFGVLTEIDVKATLKKKLDVDFRNYKILGACNPEFAYKALQTEDKIGTMLPCNVIVQENSDGRIEISAVNPLDSMAAIDNPGLKDIASDVKRMLEEVIDKI